MVNMSIQLEETGRNIKSLLDERNLKVRDIQDAMGFENPQAVYKWISGKSLPGIDNLVILSKILNVNIEEILVIGGDFHFLKDGIFLNYRLNDKLIFSRYH